MNQRHFQLALVSAFTIALGVIVLRSPLLRSKVGDTSSLHASTDHSYTARRMESDRQVENSTVTRSQRPLRVPDFPGAIEIGHWESTPEGNVKLCQGVKHFAHSYGKKYGHRDRALPPPQDPWELNGPGEYVEPHRTPHVMQYRLRPFDELEFVYRRTRTVSTEPYRFNVGDRIQVESMTEDKLQRTLDIEPDGHITLPPAMRVLAAGKTIAELTAILEEKYKKLYRVPAITITPINVETRLKDLLESVDNRQGISGGLIQQAVVTPEGTVQLPVVESVYVNGMTLGEVERELELRYAKKVQGLEVTPRLTKIAPRFAYVTGEVLTPGRVDLSVPTTVTMAIAQAGNWTFGGNLKQVVIYRRTPDWRLIATRINLHDAWLGKDPSPCDEIWLRDSDVIIVPKTPLRYTSEFVTLLFSDTIYRVLPNQGINYNVSSIL